MSADDEKSERRRRQDDEEDLLRHEADLRRREEEMQQQLADELDRRQREEEKIRHAIEEEKRRRQEEEDRLHREEEDRRRREEEELNAETNRLERLRFEELHKRRQRNLGPRCECGFLKLLSNYTLLHRNIWFRFGYMFISVTLDSSSTAEFQQETTIPLDGASVSTDVDHSGFMHVVVLYTPVGGGPRDRIVIETAPEQVEPLLRVLQEKIVAVQEVRASWLLRHVLLLHSSST